MTGRRIEIPPVRSRFATFRGAGYEGFDGQIPEHTRHFAIGANYAHVTAPLRRLIDRFGNEIVLALCAGKRPPGWVLAALESLPPRQRMALTLRYLDECSVSEIADAMDVGYTTAESLLGRARRSFARAYGEQP